MEVQDLRQKDFFRDVSLKPEAEGRTRLYDHDPRQANNEVQDPRQKGMKRDVVSGTQAGQDLRAKI